MIAVAILSHSRVLPDKLDHVDHAINSSFVVDLDYHFRSVSLGNYGAVAECMVFALVQVLSVFGSQFKDLVELLISARPQYSQYLNEPTGSLRLYLKQRLEGQDHVTAFGAMESGFVFDVWIYCVVTNFIASFQKQPPCIDKSLLARVSNVTKEDLADFFYRNLITMEQIPDVMHLENDAHEIVILNEYCTDLCIKIHQALPSSKIPGMTERTLSSSLTTDDGATTQYFAQIVTTVQPR